MPTVVRDDPYAGYNFRVIITTVSDDGVAVSGSFSEVSGLEVEVPPILYRNGSEDITQRKIPGLKKFTDITLKRGVTGHVGFWNWIVEALNGKVRRTAGSIMLLDENRNEVMRWNFSRAWPCKYTAPAPLRSDIAGFIGRTRRGAVGEALRVDGLPDLQRRFGGLDPGSSTGYAVRGYFENGGQVAWVVRVSGPAATTADALWTVGDLAGFAAPAFRVTATSPGAWANGATVRLDYRATSLAGAPEVDVRVSVPGEPVEAFRGLPAAALAGRLEVSQLVRFQAAAAPLQGGAAPAGPGPVGARRTITLGGGGDGDGPPGVDAYLEGVERLGDQPEIAIVAAPDLNGDLPAGQGEPVVTALLEVAAAALDRLVVLDVPPERLAADQAVDWANAFRPGDPTRLRAAAAYHPPLRVRDPLGTAATPLRTVPACGHVAGVISRLDRERGAHHTPANAVVLDAVDLEQTFDEAEELAVYQAGVRTSTLARSPLGRTSILAPASTSPARSGGRVFSRTS